MSALLSGEEEIMRGNRRAGLLGVALVCFLVASWHTAASKTQAPKSRNDLHQAFKDNNFKDAYDGLRKLVLDPKHDPKLVVEDYGTALHCLLRLGRVDEIDE